MNRLKFLLIFLIVFKLTFMNCEELFATINTRKSLNVVDEKFLSIVIDPMILLSGLNISDITLNLASHLSPAFIRFHGPSTPSFIFSNEFTDTEERLTVTPDMWTSLNEWITKANLTGIFALSDRERVNEAWNAKTVLPLMELADKMNLNCYWELGNEFSNTSLSKLSEDIHSLLHIQDAFPNSKNKWKTITGDMTQSILNSNYDEVKKFMYSVNGEIKAINWNPVDTSAKYVNSISKYLMTIKPKLPVWTNAPRFAEPTSFTNGLQWAKYIGDAAKQGYDVVFRQPKIREFYEITPAYLITLLHKQLMGKSVLEIRASNARTNSKSYIYAHCTKHQHSFPKSGAVTFFTINMQEHAVNTSIKFFAHPIKNVEIQSYIFRSPDENTTSIFLNDELLHDTELIKNNFELKPEIHRTNIGKYLVLTLPARSVGFFVIPNAKIHACIAGENELDLIREEISLNQRLGTPYEEIVSATENSKITDESEKIDNLITMTELYKLMERELESNERYYQFADKRKEWKENLIKQIQQQKDNIDENVNKLTEEERNAFIHKVKLMDAQKHFIENGRKELASNFNRIINSKLDKLNKQNTENVNVVEEIPVDEKKQIAETNKGIEKMLNKLQEDLNVQIGGSINTNNVRARRGLYLRPYNPCNAHNHYNYNSYQGFDKQGDDSKYVIKIHESHPEHSDISINLNSKEVPLEQFENIGEHEKKYGEIREELKGYELSEIDDTTHLKDSKKSEKTDNNKEIMAKEIHTLRSLLKEYNEQDVINSKKVKRDLKQKLAQLKSPKRPEFLTKLRQSQTKVGERRQQFRQKFLERKQQRALKRGRGAVQNGGAKETILEQNDRAKRFAIIDVPDETISLIAEAISNLPSGLPNIDNAFVEEIEVETVKDSNQAKESDLEDVTSPFKIISEEIKKTDIANEKDIFNDPIIMLVGKPVDLANIDVDEKKKESQIKYLKERLARKKHFEEKKQNFMKNQLKNIDDAINLRKRRSIANFLLRPYNIRDNEIDSNDILDKLKQNEIKDKKIKNAEIMLNDISKEGKDIADFLNEAEEDIYKIIIPKVKSETLKKDNIVLNKNYSKVIDLNIYNESTTPVTETRNTKSSTEATSTIGYEKHYTIHEFDGMIPIENEETFIEDDMKKLFVPKFRIVNSFFDTLAQLISNFHNKVLNYAVYISQ